MPSISSNLSAAITSLSNQSSTKVSSSTSVTTADSSITSSVGHGTDNVTVSALAQHMSEQSAKWDSMSKSQLNALYDKTMNQFLGMESSMRSQGAAALDQMPDSSDPARIELAERAAQYNLSIHSSPPGNVANPFANVPRDQLVSIVYDDSGTFTLSERYAAWAEQSRQDYVKLSAMFEGVTSGESLPPYEGLLSYFDDLSPVEKSIYPDDYRSRLEQLLKAQQAEYGLTSTVSGDDSTNGENAESTYVFDKNLPIVDQLVEYVIQHSESLS